MNMNQVRRAVRRYHAPSEGPADLERTIASTVDLGIYLQELDRWDAIQLLEAAIAASQRVQPRAKGLVAALRYHWESLVGSQFEERLCRAFPLSEEP